MEVKKCVPNCSNPTTTTVYVFSGAKVIAEYVNGAQVSSPTREFIYLGGQLLATIEGSTTTYHHQDHLSVRVTTNTSGSIIAQSGHFPYGENWYESGGANKLKFTSYERDAESGNDYPSTALRAGAIFRTHIPRLGRFNRPDPIAGSIADPQSLNRFAYVRNDPINLVDPLGLNFLWWDDETDCMYAYGYEGEGEKYWEVTLYCWDTAAYGFAGYLLGGGGGDGGEGGGGGDQKKEDRPGDPDIYCDPAVIAAFQAVWDQTRLNNWEFWLYMSEDAEGTRRASKPRMGKERDRSPLPPVMPDNTLLTAHAHRPPESGREQVPSTSDETTAQKHGKPMYVVTRDALYEVDAKTGKSTAVREKAKGDNWWEPCEKKKD